MTKVLIFAYFVKNLIEMRGAGGIVAISIPFTAGTMVAALMPPGGGETYLLMALCGSAIVAVLCSRICLPGERKAELLVTFFILGMVGYASAALAISVRETPQWAESALEKFCALLDSIDFGDSATGPLVKALLTGRKNGLDSSVVDSFRESGASHVLALSGLHLGVLYGILKKVLSVLGNSRTASVIRSILVIAASAFYMVMTGASPSIVRAFLFITAGEISRQLPGRRRSHLNIFCTALTVQLCINPLIISSVGFQLSYLAMLGILTLFPELSSWYPEPAGYDPVRKIWKSLSLSISCQAFTAPLVWYKFHSFPTYFLLTNLIALPLVEALIVCALATAAMSAAGWCPETVKGLTDFLGRTLVSSLETISCL